jgi:PKD domain
MARVNRTRGVRVSPLRRLLDGTLSAAKPRRRRKGAINSLGHFQGLEALESRLMMTVNPTLSGGTLTVTGTANEINTISIVLANDGSAIIATVDGDSATFSTSAVDALVINAGSRSDSIKVDSNIFVSETLTEGRGAPASSDPTTGTSDPSTGSGSSSTNTGSSSTGTGDPSTGSGSSSTSTGSSSTGTGDPSTGGSSSSSGGGSSGSLISGHHTIGGSGTSGTGSGSSSTGSGSTSTGTGSSSTGVGSSSTGTGSSSTGKGSSSTGSGSSSTGTGSSSTGTGSSSTGSGSSSSGSGSSGAGSTTSDPSGTNGSTSDGTSAQITFTSSQTILEGTAVNVNALASTLGAGNQVQATYDWDFGDPSGAYDQLQGFNAAHVYDTTGDYTIKLSVTDANGQTSTATDKVDVTSNDSLTTIYVSPNGSDSNSGLSESSPIQSFAQVGNILGSNERILFQAGGTYDAETGITVQTGMSNIEIGTYGSGAAPVIMYDGPNGHGAIFNLGGTNVTLQGLDFDSIYTNNGDGQAIYSGVAISGNNVTVRNNTFGNLEDDFDLSAGPNNVLIQGNQSPNTNTLNAYFAWVQGNNVSIVGNYVADSIGEAIVRIGGANNVLIADNNFTKQLDNGDKNVLSIQAGSYAYIYNNILSTGPTSVGPLGVSSADPDVSFDDAVFDSNYVLNNNFLIQPGAHDLMFRNNVVEGDGNTGFTINGIETNGSFNWQVQNVWIQNNTVTEPGEWGGFLTISNGDPSNVNVADNLFVDPNYQTGFGEAFVIDNNGELNGLSQIKDNVWSVPSLIAGWAQGGEFFVSTDPSSQAGWLTPAEWEATGVPTGDYYENVNLGSNYAVDMGSFTAGSSLSTAL